MPSRMMRMMTMTVAPARKTPRLHGLSPLILLHAQVHG